MFKNASGNMESANSNIVSSEGIPKYYEPPVKDLNTLDCFKSENYALASTHIEATTRKNMTTRGGETNTRVNTTRGNDKFMNRISSRPTSTNT